jgi:hypothetical protein
MPGQMIRMFRVPFPRFAAALRYAQTTWHCASAQTNIGLRGDEAASWEAETEWS